MVKQSKFLFPLILISFFYSAHLNAQEYLSYTKEWIRSSFDEADPSLNIIDDSTVIRVISSSYDKYTATFYFSPSNFNGDLSCDSILYQSECKECAELMLQKLYSDSLNQWVEIKRNQYLSKKRTNWDVSFSKNRISDCKQMIITQTPEEKINTTISFAIRKMRTLEWKEIMKGK